MNIIVDEWEVDDETGEVLRHIEAPFSVIDRDSAEWVMGKLLDADAMILCEQARLAAITDCIQSRITAQRRRRQWLEMRFSAELERYASAQLAGAKGKTLVLDHGRIAFHKTPGSTVVSDMPRAVQWARLNAPDAVKVIETVLVTPLKDRKDLPVDIFTVTPAGEKCSIKTGIR